MSVDSAYCWLTCGILLCVEATGVVDGLSTLVIMAVVMPWLKVKKRELCSFLSLSLT